ncbi:sulfotransferase [Hyphococcus sp.]|uniref:sulfotransferase family protein n=1 Tax=Hyphococcus sp. TaxID=2038636 RepID=UPI003CCBD3B5
MGLKIIGAGFGRTGTASLKLALEKLGFGPCYHMSEVLANAGHIDLWNDVADGAADWETIFKNYQSTVDFPASIYWRALAAAYPDAKVVLSLRDAERWYESTQETILSEKMWEFTGPTRWGGMLDRTIRTLFEGDIHDRDTLIRIYNEHNETVKAAFGPDRLLVFEAKDGWAPLCAFLGVEVPDEAYPRVNSREELQGMIAMLESDAGRAMINGDGMPAAMREQVFGKG